MRITRRMFLLPVIVYTLISGSVSSCKKDLPASSALPVIAKTIPDISFQELNAQELRFDNVYYAMGSTNYTTGKPAVNGEAIGRIPDRKGNAPLIYAGTANPTITGVPPQLIDDKWLMFDNRPNTNYNSLPVAPISPPFEATLISRNMPGQLFEAKMQNGNNALYCGDIGSPVRVFDSKGNIPNSVKAQSYETTIERIVVKPTGVDYWLNGKFVGTYSFNGLSSEAVLANTIKKYHSMGTFTNSMDFDFGALYFKTGIFSDTEYADVYSSLASKWKPGTLPDEILLNKINWVNKDGTYTPSATIINTPKGVTVADPSQWDYQWFWKDDETNYDTQTLFSTKMIVNTGDFPANDEKHHNVAIKFRVRPKDTKGASWRYISGTFSSISQTYQ